MREQLSAAKKERTALLASLAALRRTGGRGGGDLQAQDVDDLREEVALKQEKLNQLRASNLEAQSR